MLADLLDHRSVSLHVQHVLNLYFQRYDYLLLLSLLQGHRLVEEVVGDSQLFHVLVRREESQLYLVHLQFRNVPSCCEKKVVEEEAGSMYTDQKERSGQRPGGNDTQRGTGMMTDSVDVEEMEHFADLEQQEVESAWSFLAFLSRS